MGRKRIEINKDEVYGKLKTTGKFIYKGKKYLCWECECKCGNIVYASASDLKTGHTTSCGKCEDKAYRTGLNYLYGMYVRGARIRNLPFELTKELFNAIITQRCFYCGSKPEQILYKQGMQKPFTYNGIDRIDNNLGYEIGNVIPCCRFCNMAKGRHTFSEFEKWIKKLISFRTGKEEREDKQ